MGHVFRLQATILVSATTAELASMWQSDTFAHRPHVWRPAQLSAQMGLGVALKNDGEQGHTRCSPGSTLHWGTGFIPS